MRFIRPFLLAIIAAFPGAAADEPAFLGPVDVAASADGLSLYVALEGSNATAVVDRPSGAVVRVIALPARPNGLCVAGTRLAVSCGAADGRVLLIDPNSGAVVRSIEEVGHTPRSPVASADGRTLYLCNRFSGDVAVIDLDTGQIRARVPMPREPYACALSPDGLTLAVANLLPADRSNGPVVSCQVALIDTVRRSTRLVRLPSGSTSARGVAITPDGRLALVVHVLGRFMLPTSQVERGWMNTNVLSLIDLKAGALVATVPLDEPDRGAANPWDVAVTPDGRRFVVSLSGTHELCVIDAEALLAKIAGPSVEAARHKDPRGYGAPSSGSPETDLSFLVGMSRRIALNPPEWPSLGLDPRPDDQGPLNGPRGLALSGPDAFVATYFSGVLAQVSIRDEGEETRTQAHSVRRIPLGDQAPLTSERRGERAFHDATLGLQGWQSCASCHPDGRADGLNWDLLNDGVGNPSNAKSLLLAHQTPPSMISGVRADAATAVRSGFRYILFGSPGEEAARDIDAYLKALRPEPSPWREAAPPATVERGRVLFESPRIGCASCHPAPLFTDLRMHDVGSKAASDRRDTFDTPTLVEIWRTAPYLHDGRYATLDELLRDGRHGHGRGAVETLTPGDLDDLIAYLRTL